MRVLVFLGWIVFLTFLVWPLLKRVLRPRLAPPRAQPLRDELVKDPVCQTYVARSRAVTTGNGDNRRYFCSAECAARFAAESRG